MLIRSYVDPAYPPSRQTIYLGVAQPRALIVLKGAGKINPNVRKFINSELDIKVEVPALQLPGGGKVVGGSIEEGSADALAPQTRLAETDPNVVIGPDSIGTLSFTSGSTGVPKGVRGRHYSLTHFFPWMGQRFEIGEHSRFTMLSGIAHDPIQRDSQFLVTPCPRQSLIVPSFHTALLRGPAVCPNPRRYRHAWQACRVDGRTSGYHYSPHAGYGSITLRPSHGTDSNPSQRIFCRRCLDQERLPPPPGPCPERSYHQHVWYYRDPTRGIIHGDTLRCRRPYLPFYSKRYHAGRVRND